jgi:serine protease Do
MRKFGVRAGGIVLAAVLAVAAPSGPLHAQQMSFNQAQLVRTLLPTVVNITARAAIGGTAEPVMASASGKDNGGAQAAAPQIRVNAGSGFIIDPSGQIATNWHVVVGAYEIVVTFSDGTRAKAQLLNASPLVDLAVIKVNAGRKLQAVRWGDSAKVQVGDPVLAIGNPLGVGLSVSGGLVSALNRNIMDTPYDDFIQTDAAINHGNSGGPLFDMNGEVIGVNSALISPTSANAGLGFAMPSNDARFIFDRLTRKAMQRPGYIGVRLQPVTAEMAAALGMNEPQGSIVAAVEKASPAEQAGLRNGDVLLRFAGETPPDERALLRAIARAKPGSSAVIALRRATQEMEVPVTIAEWPTMWWEEPGDTAAPRFSVPPDLGLMLSPLDDAMRAQYEVGMAGSGVLITGVLPGTDAAQRGLGQGDVITQVGPAEVRTPAEVEREIERARAEKREFALFLVMRKNQAMTPAQAPAAKWYALRVAAAN